MNATQDSNFVVKALCVQTKVLVLLWEAVKLHHDSISLGLLLLKVMELI